MNTLKSTAVKTDRLPSLDRAVLGRLRDGVYYAEDGSWHFSDHYRYTWILTSMVFGVTTMLGVFAGHIMKNGKDKLVNSELLLATGLVLLLAGWMLSFQTPIIKQIWTTSMTLWSGGWCFILMALFYYIVDYKRWSKGLNWLKIYGMNSIIAYTLGMVIDFRSIANSLLWGLEKYVGDYYGAILTFANFMILNTTYLLITLIAIVTSIIAYKHYLNKKKYQHPLYLNNLQKISEFIDLIQSLDDYVTWVQRDQLKAKYSNLGKYFKNKTNYYRKEPNVKKFNDIFQDFDRFIVGYNQSYVYAQKEKLKDYFDDIEGKKLDVQQRTALITDEYSNLILAGAGSGKTLTILGKVKYLIEQKSVIPQDILLLSFTRKTVEELNDRLNKMGLATNATTFHKLGYDILKQYHSNIPVLTNENTLEIVIREYFEKDIVNDLVALQSYIQYISCYMNIPEENDKFDSMGEKLDLEKGIDFQTLKSKCEPLNIVSNSNLDTIQGGLTSGRSYLNSFKVL